MTIIIAAGVILAGVAYLLIGLRYVAPIFVTREVSRQIRAYPGLASQPGTVADWRSSAATDSLWPALVWPCWLLAIKINPAAMIARRAPLTDLEAEFENGKRDTRIAVLEREAGIPR